eukprot:m.31163 g.31163  ORF g.31163 m.31163 type:complete len:1036 (+) comp31459_c0_seq1:32-3139(+)
MANFSALLRFLDEGRLQDKADLKPRILSRRSSPSETLPLPRLFPGETLILQLGNVYCYDSLGFKGMTKGILHLTDYKLSFTGREVETHDDRLRENMSDEDEEEEPESIARRGWMSQRIKQGWRSRRKNQKQSPLQVSVPRLPGSPQTGSLKRTAESRTGSLKRNSPSILRRLKGLGRRSAAAIDPPTAPSYQSRMRSLALEDMSVFNSFDEEPKPTDDGHRFETEVNIPLTSVYKIKKPKVATYHNKEEGVRLSECLQVECCTGTILKFGFTQDEASAEALKGEIERVMRPQYFAKLFAFSYRNALNSSLDIRLLEDTKSPNFYTFQGVISLVCIFVWNLFDLIFQDEFGRLGLIDVNPYTWRVATVTQQLCPTYPKEVVIPRSVSDIDLRRIAAFHRYSRFPAVCWKDARTGAVLLRAASTTHRRGKLSTRCEADEAYVRALCMLNSSAATKLMILSDPPVSTVGKHSTPMHRLSRAEAEFFYYPESTFVYSDCVDESEDSKMIRKSSKAFRRFLHGKTEAGRYYSLLEESNWLGQIHKLLSTAVEIADAVKVQAAYVLIAYENGWDRTAQVSSLAQLLLDPFYRTLNGFQILIQKEWLAFGHKFTSRTCPWLLKTKEGGPVFLQFLDCVWQIMMQFPRKFEFNEAFLQTLANEAYSTRFGTFLMDSEREREKKDVHKGTVSFWRWMFLVQQTSDKYNNLLYEPEQGPRVLYPLSSMSCLKLWTSYYCRYRQEDHLSAAEQNCRDQARKLLQEYQELKDKFIKVSTAAGVSTEKAVNDLRKEVASLSGKMSSSSCGVSKDQDHSAHIQQRKLDTKEWWTQLEKEGSEDDADEGDGDGENNQSQPDCQMTELPASRHLSNGEDVRGRRFTLGGLMIRGQRSISSQLSSPAMSPPTPASFDDTNVNFLDVIRKSGLILGDPSVHFSKALCSGYLSKVGGRHKAWRKRWFVLDLNKHCIAYFEDEKTAMNKQAPKGVIKLTEINGVCKFDKKSGKNHVTFAVETSHRTYFMHSPSSVGVDVWISCIAAASPLVQTNS